MNAFERNAFTFPGTAGAADGFALLQTMAGSVARANLEWLGLASRRARAHMELPRQMAGCRTLAEMSKVQAEFWHGAMQDYTHCNQRMMALWLRNMKAAGQGELAHQAERMAAKATKPLAEAAERAMTKAEEAPAAVWEWWRTDLKAIKPRRNGQGEEADERRLGH